MQLSLAQRNRAARFLVINGVELEASERDTPPTRIE